MRTLFVTPQGEALASVIIWEAREGDYTMTIEACGFAEDVFPILCARLFSYCHPKRTLDVVGLMYDDTRRIVDIEGALDPRCAYALAAAGFTVPLAFLGD